MTDVIEVHTTIDSEEAAQKIAQAIVAKRLAACVQVSGPITRVYWWQEKIDQTQEWLCTIKTTKELYSDLEQIIRENHTYDTPEILAVSVLAGSEDYLEWVQAETHMNTKEEQETKEQLIQEFEEAYRRLVIAASAASARGVSRKGSQWGPREVIAHIAGWNVEATERLPRVIAGQPPLKYDDEAFNVAIITILGDQSFDVVLEMFQQTHLRYVQMLTEQDDKVFVPNHPVYKRIRAVILHHNEHTQQLDELT